MSVLALSLVGLTVIALIAGYLRNRSLQRKLRRGEIDRIPEVKDVDSQCCGQHAVCEKESLLSALSREIVYYDDEELDRFAGLSSGAYSGEQVEQFREVLYTMNDADVAGWVRSLQLRGINLPDELKDEVFLIVGERRIAN